VGVMPHQGAWEGHVQGEAVQADSRAGGSARDVLMLNWRTAAAGEPRELETLMRGSERGGEKRPARDLARRLLYFRVTESPSESESGKAVHLAKGDRYRRGSEWEACRVQIAETNRDAP
jgi:hypothetical protein